MWNAICTAGQNNGAKKGAAVSKRSVDYIKSHIFKLSCRNTAINASFNTKQGFNGGMSDEMKAGQDSSSMTPDDEAPVMVWSRISRSAILGTNQKGYTIYESVNKFKNFKMPGYTQKQNDESIERFVRKMLSEYHVILGMQPIVEQLRTFHEHSNY